MASCLRQSLSPSCQRRLASLQSLGKTGPMKGGWVYIMADAPLGTIYIGVTADLAARTYQHKTGKGSDFCRKYGLNRLVYVEKYPTIHEAIAREKAMKAWKRIWKTDKISALNPDWADLFEHIL